MTTRIASCSCGQLTAITSEEPLRVSVCHCLACQRRSGSVFAAQARFTKRTVAVNGSSHTFARVGDEGGSATFHFCPTCGVTVYFTSSDSEDTIVIPVGVFADPAFPAPVFSVYEERMHGWVQMPKDIGHMF